MRSAKKKKKKVSFYLVNIIIILDLYNPNTFFLSILLYSKVGQPEMVQETARVWLHCPTNSQATGFRTVAELYLLHVLVPLGQKDEAVELIVGEVGSSAFTEEQRRTALDVVEEKERQNREANGDPVASPNPEVTSPQRGTINHNHKCCFSL